MQKRGAPFQGILFVGLIITKDGAKLVEYNIRWGDPETQVIVPRIQTDLLELFYLASQGKLSDAPPVVLSPDAALCVVMAANGYPGHYDKGSIIHGLDEAAVHDKVKILHAGTKQNDQNQITAHGGRVLNVVGFGADIKTAQANAYAAIADITWPEGFYRCDIGWRELE